MSARSRKTPSPEIEGYVNQITDALTEMNEGEDHLADLYRAVDGAVRTVSSSESQVAGMSRWTTFEATFGQIIGENVSVLRDKAGWTQAGVAEAMVTLGFDWKRITYAEVEASTRRVTFEELLGLAVLFAVPVVKLLIPATDPKITTLLAWETGDMTASMVEELLIGHGGTLGQGGLTWKAAARAAGAPRRANDWRPAADLWGTREGSVEPAHTDRPRKSSS
jgi:transcriptional regulator with XRE-family HTH domain